MELNLICIIHHKEHGSAMFVKNIIVIISTETYEEGDIDLPQLSHYWFVVSHKDTYQIWIFLHGHYIFLSNCPLFVVFFY